MFDYLANGLVAEQAWSRKKESYTWPYPGCVEFYNKPCKAMSGLFQHMFIPQQLLIPQLQTELGCLRHCTEIGPKSSDNWMNRIPRHFFEPRIFGLFFIWILFGFFYLDSVSDDFATHGLLDDSDNCNVPDAGFRIHESLPSQSYVLKSLPPH